jgi:hypothetical protein
MLLKKLCIISARWSHEILCLTLKFNFLYVLER